MFLHGRHGSSIELRSSRSAWSRGYLYVSCSRRTVSRNATFAVVHERSQRADGRETCFIETKYCKAGPASLRPLLVEKRKYLRSQACGIYAAGFSVQTMSPELLDVLVVNRGADM